MMKSGYALAVRHFVTFFLIIFPSIASAAEGTFSGFWKIECIDAFGLQIMPYSNKLYSVSFCGPTGCYKPGSWASNTAIENDSKYRIIDNNTLDVKREDAKWERFIKCTTETNPKLDYQTMAKSKKKKPTGETDIYIPFQGMPIYDKTFPFTITDSKQYSKFRQDLEKVTPVEKQCKAGTFKLAKDWYEELWTNICDLKKMKELKDFVRGIAPSFANSEFTLWVANLDGSKEPDLIIGKIDFSKGDDFDYPYLSLWRLKDHNDTYQTAYAGRFLSGTIHSIRPFGTKPDQKTVFVKHLSCLECEPTVYLTAIDFVSSEMAHSYEFTYSEKHDGYDTTIEYDLPGMGHTVDAKVETRLLPPTDAGPHLLQFYKMEEGPDEYWAFTCREYKCDYQIYKKEAPDSFKKLWKKAKHL